MGPRGNSARGCEPADGAGRGLGKALGCATGEVVRVGASPSVDGLVRVAHGQNPRSVPGPPRDQGALQGRGVLGLVHGQQGQRAAPCVAVQGRFQDDETFLREYPIKMTVRGSSQWILDFLASLSDPEAVARLSGGSPGGAQARRLLPVASMRNFGKDRTTRGDDAMQAEITLRALRVSTEAEVQ